MCDISMCRNFRCPLCEGCYRFKALPDPYQQSYAEFKPDKKGKCEYFMTITGRSTPNADKKPRASRPPRKPKSTAV
jgi:hypothetical protein